MNFNLVLFSLDVSKRLLDTQAPDFVLCYLIFICDSLSSHLLFMRSSTKFHILPTVYVVGDEGGYDMNEISLLCAAGLSLA